MKILYCFFRFLLGAYLIFLGFKGLSDININKTTLENTVDLFENKVLAPYNLNTNMKLLRQHPIEILYFENLCIIWGGFLMLFGFGLGKAFVTTGLLVEFVFLNNILFYQDQKTIFNFSLLLSLFGGIMSIN